ncbi:hypothetical protein CIPAW_02G020300 [Carya illinoinensis]|uniref:Uncharacterized protein n=1 Tax=Carya illinoinensis TaxID=32201 RepID=A0A8T1R9T8_CARIL|nr:hypothetical protein CIPAW_02G020300 [Carya illinoinensis]
MAIDYLHREWKVTEPIQPNVIHQSNVKLRRDQLFQ